MKVWKPGVIAVTVALVGLAGGWWASAGPVLPKPKKPSDEMISLAGLKKFRLNAQPVIGFAKDVQSITEFAEKAFREHAEDAGFEIGQDLDLLQVILTVIGNTDPDQPEALSLYVAISVYQPVYVDRLQRKLIVPTATILKPELTTQGRLLDTLDDQVRFTVGMMKNFIQTADEYVAATGPPKPGR